MTRHEEPAPRMGRPEPHTVQSRPGISDETAALIQDIRNIKEETRRYMRALFEEYLGPLKGRMVRMESQRVKPRTKMRATTPGRRPRKKGGA